MIEETFIQIFWLLMVNAIKEELKSPDRLYL